MRVLRVDLDCVVWDYLVWFFLLFDFFVDGLAEDQD